jgi:methyl-accepting chemotaxis protein
MRPEINPENPESRRRQEIEKQIEENQTFLLDMINILSGLIEAGSSFLGDITKIIKEYMIGKRRRENIVQDLQNIIIPIHLWMEGVSRRIEEVRDSVNTKIETNYELLAQLESLISPDEFKRYVDAFNWTVTTIINLIDSLERIVRGIYRGINEMANIHFENETVRRLLENFEELKKMRYGRRNGNQPEKGQN